MEASLSKGDPVCVVGRLRYDQYQTKEGEDRSKTYLIATHVGPDLTYCTAKVERNGNKETSK